MPLRILGVGLSKTGTTSLGRALRILGFSAVGYEERRLRRAVLKGLTDPKFFRCYNDVDAAVDLPAATYWEQLERCYPGLRFILTVRDEDAWWKSIEHHFNVAFPMSDNGTNEFRRRIRVQTYGSAVAVEGPYRAAYREHNRQVQEALPPARLLLLNLSERPGWESLCDFLDRPRPSMPYPWLNRTFD